MFRAFRGYLSPSLFVVFVTFVDNLFPLPPLSWTEKTVAPAFADTYTAPVTFLHWWHH
jgi:hypothetical protein